jgi:peptide/nickel transport system ATP-binding protein
VLASMPQLPGAAATSAPPVVAASGLTVTLTRDHRAHRVLRGIDLTIARGEILGLVGESGSGKSVLGLTLLGLLRQEARPLVAGTLSVAGVDLLAASPRELRDLRRHHLGAVFQDPMTSLDPTLRIGAQLLEIVDRASDAVALLEACGIRDAQRRMRAYPHELSGGLRQRVMIAIAVAGEPQLIVADEPTTALDVTVQAQILELLHRLRRELGCSVVLVTHDLAVAAQVSDRVAVMYGGRIVELGPTAELLAAPRHPYTTALLRSRLDLDTDRTRMLTTLPGEPPDLRAMPPGCAFAPRCAFHQAACDEQVPPLRVAGPRADACLRSDALTPARERADGEAWPAVAIDGAGDLALHAVGVEVDVGRASRLRRRPRLRILHGVDLTVRQGEAVALVGESGSGKTTFVRAAAGLMAVTGGSLSVRDAAPQMVFQDAGSSLTPWLPVGETIGERLRAEGLSRTERAARIAETLATVGLPPATAALRPGQLSGGQRQRVAIARAIIVPPRLLLCDEPTSALDVSVAAGVLNLLGELRRRLGMALVFVTHDLAVARMVADRIAVMHQGRIVEVGPAADVLADPADPYTRTLLASVPSTTRVA